MIRALIRQARRFLASNSGATAALFTLMIPVAIGMAALVVDLNYARNVQKQMQTSADAAALAASMDIGSPTADPLATAANYSATAGGRNAIAGVTVTMATGYPQLRCLTPATTFGLCVTSPASAGSPSANAIFVQENATVSTIFSKYFGLNSLSISVTSAAAGHGGNSKQLDVMVILDTTASMNTNDSSCKSTRIACAQGGVQTLLKTLAPSVDQVGLMVFPGVKDATNAAYDYNCSGANPAIVSYKSAPLYTIVGLNNDFRTSDGATTLNTSSNIVRAVGAGGAGCTTGLQAIGGYGTFYADAVTAAQAYLVAHGRTAAQKVIIILTDGDAQSSTAPNTLNECGQAVTAAATAKSTGTWVYTIGYGAGTSGTCANDKSPSTTACATLGSMATDSAHFFYDSGSSCSGGQSATSLQNAFQQVANSLMAPMLIPFNSV